jgi:hypothetical protein
MPAISEKAITVAEIRTGRLNSRYLNFMDAHIREKKEMI